MHIRLIVYILLVVASAQTTAADVVTDYATGKCGRNLLNIIHDHCRPANLQTNLPESDKEKNLIAIFDVAEKNSLPDFLSTDRMIGDDILRISNHILPEWFNQGNTDKDLAASDLFNTFPTTQTNRDKRQSLPMLDTAESIVGKGTTTDGKYQAYQPSDRWKGTLARMALYVAAIYGRPSAWQGNGALVFEDFQEYPLLSRRAIQQYMTWHNSFPPDTDEIARAKRIEQLQGNINPFISHPTLADHIWGISADIPFVPPTQPEDPDNPDDPDTPSDPVPLHAIYTTAETIFLYSPYINSGSTWEINGKQIDTSSIKASDIGPGQHELHFSNSTQSGKLLITIQQ